jgi:hypothetical protein
MVGPDIACCYHGDEIMRRRLFDARVLYVMRVANVLRSIEAKPVLHDLIICKRDDSARPFPGAGHRASPAFGSCMGMVNYDHHDRLQESAFLWLRPRPRRGSRGQGLYRSSLVPPGGAAWGVELRTKTRPPGGLPVFYVGSRAKHYTWAVMIMVIRAVRLQCRVF